MTKLEATINVIKYDLIVKKPTMSYEELMKLRKQLKQQQNGNTTILTLRWVNICKSSCKCVVEAYRVFGEKIKYKLGDDEKWMIN